MGKTCTLPTGQSQYQVVGRFVPNEKYGEGHAQCKVYRMKLFAKNKVVARSRFWYFMGRLCRVKKANGQIISISQARHRLRAPACAPSRPPLPAPAPRCGGLAPVPGQSSGLPGAETGFDPLYFSDFLDIKFLREAELKHGRICMLAATGYMVQEFFSLPSYPGYSPNPVEAVSSVPPEGLLQIVFFVSWLEIVANKGKFAMTDMFESGRAPGDLGFDPLKFGENKETRMRLEMAELKNGRLAMLAFSGMIHQPFVTGKPLFASLNEIFASP